MRKKKAKTKATSKDKKLDRAIWAMTKTSTRLLQRFQGIADVNVRDLLAHGVVAGWLGNPKGSEVFYSGQPMTTRRVYSIVDDVLTGRGKGIFPGPYICQCGNPKGKSQNACKSCAKKLRDTKKALQKTKGSVPAPGPGEKAKGGEA